MNDLEKVISHIFLKFVHFFFFFLRDCNKSLIHGILKFGISIFSHTIQVTKVHLSKVNVVRLLIVDVTRVHYIKSESRIEFLPLLTISDSHIFEGNTFLMVDSVPPLITIDCCSWNLALAL